MRRRQLLAQAGLWLGGCGCGLHVRAQALPRVYGCVLPARDSTPYLNRSTKARTYATGQEEIILKSGDAHFDAALAQTLAHIGNTFNVLPGFAYYEDIEDDGNALATEASRLANPDGTVLFGVHLLKRLLLLPDKAADGAVAAVCAHEFGHVLQFKHRLVAKVRAGQRTVKPVELQADFLAGYYAGIRKRANAAFPAVIFAHTQFNMGDDRTTYEGHHGTPQERGDAVNAGFDVSYGRRLPLDAAIEASTRYVLALR